MLKRNETVMDLIIHYPNAFLLLTVIALRARRVPNKITGLDVYEAMVGDYESCGLTEQKYRTAKKVLDKLKIATFKATNKGTIAKLVNTDIYDINAPTTNGQATGKQRSSNGQVTTNKNVNKEKNVNKAKPFSPEIYRETKIKAGFNRDAIEHTIKETIKGIKNGTENGSLEYPYIYADRILSRVNGNYNEKETVVYDVTYTPEAIKKISEKTKIANFQRFGVFDKNKPVVKNSVEKLLKQASVEMAKGN